MIAGAETIGKPLHGRVEDGGLSPDARLSVTVIFTTPAATLAAMRAAERLASDLESRIALLAIEVVPFQLPCNQPLVPVGFRRTSLKELVMEAGVSQASVTIQICLGRDRRQCLRRLLPEHSLVVLGGGRHWWSRERKLARWLGRLGHLVAFVEVGTQTERPCISNTRPFFAFLGDVLCKTSFLRSRRSHSS